MRIAVIGAGMSGILATIKLAEAGYDDVVVYEKADRVGGTWRENTYPGIACDVPSHLYSYSFEPNPEWSHQYSPGPEIQAYFEGVAARQAVLDRTVFGAEITSARWRDARWELSTADGRTDHVDVVIAATGVLHHPSVPDIDGLDSFAGHAFHSARWDHSVPLDGQRVGVIGTGSTAVQITTALVERVAAYHLFQRTAQWVLPQANPAYTEEEKDAFRRDRDGLVALHTQLSQAFVDRFSNNVIDAESPMMRALEELCRANLEDNVADPQLRELLTPDYRAACKRLVVSPDFYRAIQHPNARLVTSQILAVEPGGVRTADGNLHELDVLVLATGFKAHDFMRPMVVEGIGGATLDGAWAQSPIAYLSISVPGLPNFFMLNGPNGPVGNFSLIDVAELQMAYILQLLDEVGGGAQWVHASQEATAAFEAARVEAAGRTIWVTGCRSWYLDRRGIPATWPWTFERFREEMSRPDLGHYARAG